MKYSLAVTTLKDESDVLGAIDRYMKDNGIQRADLAKRIGVDKSSISRMFNTRLSVRLTTLNRICDALELKLLLVRRFEMADINNFSI